MWDNGAAYPTGKLWISVHCGRMYLSPIFRNVYEALENAVSCIWQLDFYHFLLLLGFLYITYFIIYCTWAPALPFYFFYCCFVRHKFDAAGGMKMCKPIY